MVTLSASCCSTATAQSSSTRGGCSRRPRPPEPARVRAAFPHRGLRLASAPPEPDDGPMALTHEGLLSIPGLHSRYVRLASGARAHYMTAGQDGPNVILLHGGIPGSSGTAGWRFMAPFL